MRRSMSETETVQGCDVVTVFSLGKRVEEQVEGGNPAVANDDEIGSGISRRLAGTA